MKWFLTLSATSGLCIQIKRLHYVSLKPHSAGENLSIFISTQTAVALNMNAWFTATVFTGHSKLIQRELPSPGHPASSETASPKVSLQNQMGSLFGLTPSSEDKQSFSHLFTVARENEACFESQHFKGLISRRTGFLLLFWNTLSTAIIWTSCGDQASRTFFFCRSHSQQLLQRWTEWQPE